MAVSVTLSISPSGTVASGTTVTATYTVTGNGGSAGQTITISGSATVGGVKEPATAVITLGAVAPAAVTYAVPTAPGLSFKATAQPNVFTAVAP